MGKLFMSEVSKPFDKFELAAAVLLGAGAIGASVAGHQGNLWGGASVEAYGEAAAMTTKASTTYNDELTTYMQDIQADTRAKELIWEAMESEDDTTSQRQYAMASWLLSAQLSDSAFAYLGLPDDLRKKYEEGEEDWVFSEEDLTKALNTDLGQEYVDEVFSGSSDEFETADKRFLEGRNANGIGDQFSLATVILTVALFFGGLSLVFKTGIRWGFLGVGFAVFVFGVGYMSTLTWA
jgi:uncharacterized protein YukE